MIENFEALLGFALGLTEPSPKPKHTISDNYPAGGLSNSEPCMFCEDYEKLLAELEKYQWISVDDDLPKEDYGKYLVIRQGEDEPEIAYYLADVPCNGGKHGWERGMPVVLWMNLPESEDKT